MSSRENGVICSLFSPRDASSAISEAAVPTSSSAGEESYRGERRSTSKLEEIIGRHRPETGGFQAGTFVLAVLPT